MTIIDWNQPGTSIYENGIDRGVLYPKAGPGVPWTGLVRVDETFQGGEHTPYYYDGIKYFDFIASEFFQATVEAFSTPPEFAPCDGMVVLAPGLYASNQRRETFDFSYRTLVANELDDSLGYKLHLVYNCTAAPSARSYSTLGQVPNAPTRTWTFHTVPPLSTGYKPTAHLVIDSREIEAYSSDALRDLEDNLYGSLTKTPHLPLPEEVKTILASVVPATVTANV